MRFGSLSLISRVGCEGRSRTGYLLVMSQAGYCFPTPRYMLLVVVHIKQCSLIYPKWNSNGGANPPDNHQQLNHTTKKGSRRSPLSRG